MNIHIFRTFATVTYLMHYSSVMVKLRLRQIFKQKQVTQVEMARRLGVSAMTVSGWITGRRYPSIETLGQIAEMLNTPITEFFESPSSDEISLQINVGDRRITVTPEMLRSATET